MLADLLFDLTSDPCNPIIGEDVFLTGPYKCRGSCVCQQIKELHGSVGAKESSSFELSYEPNWTWEHWFDPSFVEPSFPSVLTHSTSWEDVFSSNNSAHFIKEIFINDRHLQKPEPAAESEPSKVSEPRQKFQRFREKKFICDECDRSFTMKQNVQQHFFQYHHPNGAKKKPMRILSKRFQCTKCNKIFKTIEKAQRHEARMHGEIAAPSVFVCQHCNKIYNAQSQLKEHIDVVHENRRPFKCEHCGMEFGRAGGLRRHDMMVHQQKRYACPVPECNHPGYKCTKALAAHIRSVHTKDRPFLCLHCDRTFVRKNDLKVHEMTHSAHNEFICRKCSSSFRRQIYLQKHEKRCLNGLGRRNGDKSRQEQKSSNRRRRRSSSSSDECSSKKSRCDENSPLFEPRGSFIKQELDTTESPPSGKEDDVSRENSKDGPNETVLRDIDPNTTINEVPEITAVKKEPLEDGEICDSQSESLENITATRSKKRHSHKEKKHKKKSMLVNLSYYSSTDDRSSKKKKKLKGYLKLPMKASHRHDKARKETEAENRRPRKRSFDEENREGCPKADDADKSHETAVVIRTEPLEEGEIDETSKEDEPCQQRLHLRRQIKFEPREEAVPPKKRPLRSIRGDSSVMKRLKES